MENKESKGVKFTLMAVLKEIPGGKLDTAKDLNLKEKNIKEIEELGALKALEKINLSHNLLKQCKVKFIISSN